MRSDMATLDQFLRTGELGPVRPGISLAEVVARLGPPQDESVAANPRTLKYGALQLTFRKRPDAADGSLVQIGLYYRQPAEPVPEPAQPEDFTARPGVTVAEVREFLARVGLKE